MTQAPKVFIFLDYDGTLVPIARRPDLAVLSPERKKILRRLAKCPNIKIAIISGRGLSNVKRLVGMQNIIYAGNHGFEIYVGGKHWIHPATKKFIPTLKKIKTALKNNFRHRGLLLEDKGLTLSAHYRLIPKNIFPAFKTIFDRAIKPEEKKINITHGKKVFEVRPSADWNKGKAVKWIIKELKLSGYMPIYIGDDKTDEDAFNMLKKKGITIHVGGGKTSAKMRIKDVKGVYCYLRDLIKNES